MTTMRVSLELTADGRQALAAIGGVRQEVARLGPASAGAGQAAGAGLGQVGTAATAAGGQVAQTSAELGRLSQAGANAGQEVSAGLTPIATAGRVLVGLLGAGGVLGAVMGVARAGDAMTSSLGRLQAVTGSAGAAAEAYNQLYRISLQTGVAVGDAAGAFARFAIAAREIGATNDQVAQLVRTMQQAGAVGGASTAETASATLQLGQALASGKLQGDELRSILESMPNLAVALAQQLGVNIGELRKMGEEGRLTADVVFPALLRAGQQITAEFERLPVTMERGFAQLGVATTRFVADLDRAVGLSQTIARAAQTAASALERTRQANFGTPQERVASEYDAARGRVTELERTVATSRDALRPRGPEDGTPNLVGPARAAASRALAEQERQLAVARAAFGDVSRRRAQLPPEDGDTEGLTPAAAQTAALAAARRRSREDMAGLRQILDPAGVLREEAEGRRTTIRRDVLVGNTTPEQGDRNLAAIERRLQEDLRKLNERGNRRDAEDKRPERLRDQVAVLGANAAAEDQLAAAVERGGVASRAAEARQRAVTEAMRLYPQQGAEYERALAQLTAGHERLSEAQARTRASQLAFQDGRTGAEQSLQSSLVGASAVERARQTASFQRRAELDRAGIDPDSERGRALIASAAGLAENRIELERAQASYNEIGRIGEQAFDRIGQAVTSGTLSLKDLGNIGRSVISELTQALFRLSVINPLKNLAGGNNPTLSDVGGVLGRLLGVGGSGAAASAAAAASTQALPSLAQIATPGFFGFFHGGGIAGGQPTFTRPVNDNIFANAPRYHSGGVIGPDEVPAILQRGEGVFTAEQMAAMAPAGNAVTIHMPIQFSGDSGSAADREALLAMVDQRVRQGVAAALPGTVKAAHAYTIAEVNRGGSAARALGRR